ncbi:MAG: efflux RND transporter periplasmic adaptor subunit [Chromatiales bacterium]|nr:efflux RND transporter periplasmic adaptor subunit [Chromatiales bacterium]
MSLVKQLLAVVVLCGLGVAAYQYGWPLVAPAGGDRAAQGRPDGLAAEGRRGGGRAATVLVEAVELRAERTRIKAVGTARAYRSVTLHPAAAGEVAAVHFAPDQKVDKGSVLLELDSRREKLAVDLARVRMRNARQLLSRYERSADSGAYAESTVTDARSALEEAEIALRQAEVALNDRRVVAPFDGFTGLTGIEAGDRIGTDDAITTLDDRASLLVAFSIPELFLGRIGKDHPVEVATWAARAQAIPGEIVDLGSRIDPVSRSFTARARVANEDDAFRPGMSFAVTLDVHGDRFPLVPEISVRYGTDGAYVWVVREGAAARVPVRIVERQEATVLVDAALEDGEPVVIEGIQRLRPGLAVNVAAPGETS